MNKSNRLATKLGMGALVLGAAWVWQSCVLSRDCTCTENYVWKEAVILDDQANPVDAATITVVRTSDGVSLKVPDQGYASNLKGKAILFDDGITEAFPPGQTKMEVRATASKGGKTGSGLYVLSTNACRCHFEVESGPDTLVIR